jgi:hypothetical protein
MSAPTTTPLKATIAKATPTVGTRITILKRNPSTTPTRKKIVARISILGLLPARSRHKNVFRHPSFLSRQFTP